jgi:electron transport complex protein RnfB
MVAFCYVSRVIRTGTPTASVPAQPGTVAPRAAALLLSPCKKAVRLCAQSASSAMREIGDN